MRGTWRWYIEYGVDDYVYVCLAGRVCVCACACACVCHMYIHFVITMLHLCFLISNVIDLLMYYFVDGGLYALYEYTKVDNYARPLRSTRAPPQHVLACFVCSPYVATSSRRDRPLAVPGDGCGR